MIKSKILKRISAGLMAMICAVTLFGTSLSGIDVQAAEAKEPLLIADEVIKQAATYLGVPYGWDCKGYSGVYSSNSPTKLPMATVKSNGLDCSGLVYATLTDLGVRTTGFSSNNPVPINYWETWDGSAFTNCTMTYKGVTSKIEVLVDRQNGNTDYFSRQRDVASISHIYH